LAGGFIRVWAIRQGHVLTHPKGFARHYRLCALAWAPNGEGLVSGSEDKTIKLWDLGPLPGTTRVGRARLTKTLQARGASLSSPIPLTDKPANAN
jgi:WD40 repeat protein